MTSFCGIDPRFEKKKKYILLYACYIEYFKHTFSLSISQNVGSFILGAIKKEAANKCCININLQTSDKINLLGSPQ